MRKHQCNAIAVSMLPFPQLFFYFLQLCGVFFISLDPPVLLYKRPETETMQYLTFLWVLEKHMLHSYFYVDLDRTER